MGKINNEIELCIKNLKILSVIATLLEDNKGKQKSILKIAESIAEMNAKLSVVKNTVKSIMSEIK